MNQTLKYITHGSETILKTTCFVCGKVSEVRVPTKQFFDKYCKGSAVQDAFPEMSVEDRELIVSGMCKECQKVYFADNNEEVV